MLAFLRYINLMKSATDDQINTSTTAVFDNNIYTSAQKLDSQKVTIIVNDTILFLSLVLICTNLLIFLCLFFYTALSIYYSVKCGSTYNFSQA